MDVYGLSAAPAEYFHIDDLLDLSNDELFSSTTTDSDHHHLPSSENTSTSHFSASGPNSSTDYDLYVPNDDVAELEWLSNFVDDSFNDFPTNQFTGTMNFRSDASFHGRSRSKRSRAASINTTAWSSPMQQHEASGKRRESNNNSPSNSSGTTMVMSSSDPSSTATSELMTERRCTHCASEKTPQWRTGPLGPKTLCNACGVRYKSGRLVPEYRPASSPTFVLTQHSNSHRKVMELRRQKEALGQQQQQPDHHHRQLYHHHNYEVCCRHRDGFII